MSDNDDRIDRVDVYQLARTGQALEATLPIARLPRLAETLARIDGELTVRWHGEIDGQQRPAGRLSMGGRVSMVCDRCGGLVDLIVDERRRYFFVAGLAELNRVPIDETEVEALIGSAQFNLLDLIDEESVVSLPISPRHPPGDPACVPAFGSGVAGAAEEPVAPAKPFAVLADWRAKRRGG